MVIAAGGAPERSLSSVRRRSLSMTAFHEKFAAFFRPGAFPLVLLLTACKSGGAGEGSLTVLLEPEDVIIEGLRAGEGLEAIRDGWAVQFEKYLVAVGHVELYYSTDQHEEAHADDAYVVDLKKLPASGLAL